MRREHEPFPFRERTKKVLPERLVPEIAYAVVPDKHIPHERSIQWTVCIFRGTSGKGANCHSEHCRTATMSRMHVVRPPFALRATARQAQLTMTYLQDREPPAYSVFFSSFTVSAADTSSLTGSGAAAMENSSAVVKRSLKRADLPRRPRRKLSFARRTAATFFTSIFFTTADESGKFFSTPTPDAIRRTVIVRSVGTCPLCTPITSPSKI